MFDSIRRHQKWLWILIMTLTIISFVVFFSPGTQQGQGFGYSASETVGSISGDPISRNQYIRAYREAELQFRLNYGDWPRNNEMVRQIGLMDREVRSRLLLIRKMDELGIQVSDEAAAKWIVDTFQDREKGVFLKDTYEQFVQQVLPQNGISAKDFARFAKHQVGIQHLVNVAGVSGKLVTPQEAEVLYRRRNEQLNTKAVLLSSTNYADQVTINPDDLAKHYEKVQATYRIPDRVQVDYVAFFASNYLAEAQQQLTQLTNIEQILEATYQQRGTNTFTDSNNQPLPPEAAKEKIRNEFQQQFALREARKKAIEFANELFELPAKPENLANLAAAKGLVSQTTPPFTSSQIPPGLNVPSTFAQSAFRLTVDEPFAEQPIVSDAAGAVYLLGFHSRIPSEVPPLDAVQDQVAEDYRRSRTAELVKTAGEELHAKLTNSLAEGKTFEATVAESNFTVIDLPPFSQETMALPELQNRVDISTLKTAATGLAPNTVSPFTPTRNGGLIVYLEEKVPVSEEKIKEALPEFMAGLRRDRQYQAFNDWLRNEMELAKISLAGDEQQAAN